MPQGTKSKGGKHPGFPIKKTTGVYQAQRHADNGMQVSISLEQAVRK